ncbi:MAG: glycosyltransferase [Clostridia bacterium]|nr:glycosyltransferase [Clostridia bacterium]
MGAADNKPIKKKVLFLLEGFDKGGIEKVTLDIVNNLDPEKYDITVQTFWYGGHCQSLVHENVRVIPFFFRRYVRGVIRLIQYLPPKMLYTLFVHGKYDVEIAASDGGAAKVISGSTNRNARKICWVHMDVVARGSKLPEFRNADTARHIYEKFDQISCVSANCLQRFIKKFGRYPCMNTAHNPIPTEEIRKKAEETNPYAEEEEIIRFVSVGRLAVEKGYDRLTEAAYRLCQSGFRNFKVHIIGDGEQKEKLHAIIQKYRLEDTVILEGFSANPYPYVKNADFFICSSTDEAYPLAVGESMFLGTPVLATDCSGTREWLGDSVYGMLTENSTDALYKGMKMILSDPGKMIRKWTEAAAIKTESMAMASQMDTWTAMIFDGENCI